MTRQLNGPVYLIGSDPRFRDAVHAVLDPTACRANLRVLVVGDDEGVRRVFSRDMARELLTFVRANIAAMSARAA